MPLTELIPATELVVGDRFDARTRVAKVHLRYDQVWVQTAVQGSTSPSVRVFALDELVSIRVRP